MGLLQAPAGTRPLLYEFDGGQEILQGRARGTADSGGLLTRQKNSHTMFPGGMSMHYLGLLVPMMGLSIPIIAIVLSYRQKTQSNRIKEMELQREILELEVKKQDGKIKLLEEENKKYDRIIDSESPR
ncbi:MAG: hypothetical protein LBU19_00275 [Treponema sp.]|nr:hypothetical protein [Treponema sp.]